MIENTNFKNRKKHIFSSVLVMMIFISLYITSRFNYPLFHSMNEIITIFIAASVFIIIWNGRHLLDNQYYLLISIGFLFLAFFDFMHLVGNKGMGVFPQYGNLGPTFYIISRYILSISFLIAPVFIKHKMKIGIIFALYTAFSVLILLSIFYWKNFPVTYIEGTGLTSFKIISDYIIDFIFLIDLGLLLYNRSAFDPIVLKLTSFSIVLFITTGLAFTLYTDPFGLTNAIGHFLQIISFALIFFAFVETGLAKPQNLLFRNLTQSNEEIRKLNVELENLNDDLIFSISELEKSDAALKISEAKANSLIEYAPAAIFEMDLKNLHFTSVNEVMCKMSGYSHDELYEIDPMVLLDEESSANLTDRIAKLKSGNSSNDLVEYHINKKDGSCIYMVFNISFIDEKLDKVFVIGHDVTIRRMYEDQLKESEERFRTLSETSLIGVGVSSIEGCILYTNKSYEQILGYSSNELIGKKIDSVYWNPEERQSWVTRLLNDEIIKDMEVRLKKKDGVPVWVAINASMISFGGNKSVMSTLQDISERKKAKEELQHYANELESANKELESFAYSLSHDLRAPLRALDGFSQALIEDYEDVLDASGNDYLMRIRNAAQNMAQITEGMLKLSEVIRYDLHWEKVNLSETVSIIAQDLKEKDPARKIEFVVAPGIYTNGDPSLLRILMYNLLENSWKFTSKSPNAVIEFNSTEIDGSDVFFIRDNGIGFDMKYSGNLFQPFQRLHPDNNFPGYGIGLATVLRVISRHDGKIWADSVVGKGTTFFFKLGDYGVRQ